MADRAVFLNTDIILDGNKKEITGFDEVNLKESVCESLKELIRTGFKVILFTERSILSAVHQRFKQLLNMNDVHAEGIYRWEDNSQKQGVKKNSDTILKAAEEKKIEIENSWFVGVCEEEIESASSCGCKSILIEPSVAHARIKYTNAKADYTVNNFKEASNIIKSRQMKKNISISAEKDVEAAEKSFVQETVKEGETGNDKMQISEEKTQAESEVKKREHLESSDKVEHHYLKEIHGLLKAQHREKMFSEFSGFMLIGAILQVIVVFLLIAAIWSVVGDEQNSAFLYLQFAVVFQLMTLTFLVFHTKGHL